MRPERSLCNDGGRWGKIRLGKPGIRQLTAMKHYKTVTIVNRHFNEVKPCPTLVRELQQFPTTPLCKPPHRYLCP